MRVPHQERKGEAGTDCLGRIVCVSRANVFLSEALGECVGDVNVLPGSMVSGVPLYGTIELVGFKDPMTGETRMPRRALNPGAKGYGGDFDLLRRFYEFSAETSIPVGNLVGMSVARRLSPSSSTSAPSPRHRTPGGPVHGRRRQVLHGGPDH